MIGMTVCSGIGAPETAAPFIDWRYQSEIEAFPSAVLKHRFPHAMNLGDMTKFKEWPDAAIDILVGGTPCQSFSVAGLRKGMADPRGNLALVYLAIADRYRPEWLLWENVPGVLSSNSGRDFGAFLGGLAELGYGFAYRVLDAQYVRVESHPWAVPQRRRRVFVVGHLGDWRRAAAVLFERESLSGHSPPRRAPREGATGNPGFSVVGSVSHGYGSKLGTDESCQGSVIAIQGAAGRENTSSGPDGVGVRDDGAAYTLESRSEVQAVAFQPRFARNDRGAPDIVASALTGEAGRTGKGDSAQCVAFDTTQITSSQNYSNPKDGDPCHPLAATAHPPALATSMSVRRLTPLECERLQGLPDNWTAIEYRGKPAVDGPRYKAIGNSMAVNVMNWLLTRIHASHSGGDIRKEQAA